MGIGTVPSTYKFHENNDLSMATDNGNEEEFQDEVEEEEATVDVFDCVTENGYFHKLSPITKSLFLIVGLLLVSAILYGWDAGVAEDEIMEDIELKTLNETQIETSKTITEGTITQPPLSEQPKTIVDVASCDDVCEKRETNRKTKFGGDILDPKEVLRLAKAARDETIALIKEDYGKYFDGIFVKPSNDTNPNAQPIYKGMEGVTPEGPSRDRLKRKLKLKVLKMMHAVRTSESNVIGCDCNKKEGRVNEEADESIFEASDYYEKYVFANGGHSQAAGHGNIFNETYTAYFGRDVRRIWEAIGIEFEDRNYAMGGMSASPYFTVCSKEIFGIDVDLLTWNYGMTDKSVESVAFYSYRGATSPGRPAILYIEGPAQAKTVGTPLEEHGLALFQTQIGGNAFLDKVPDCMPDGIQLPEDELEKLPAFVHSMKCKGRWEGGKICQDTKWSCTSRMKKDGSDCICPNLGKRSSWHMGYKIHALQGHLISLPFIQILIEGLEEIAASSEDTESLLIEIEKEENKEYEDFLAKPLLKDKFNFDKDFGELLQDEDLMETVFKGPSVCRTSLVPSQTRYLGISSNSDKIGGPSEGWLETYDLGVPLHRKDGEYSWEENNEPIPGIVQQTYKVDDRLDSDEWQKECPAVSMPDYKDWLYGPLKDGKTTLTFPNEKEKAYYGYDASTFKGIVGIVPPIWTENHCKCPETDIRLSRFPNHVRTTVNGKPVAKFRLFNSMAILEDENGSIFWEPSENQDYVIEFEPYGEFDGKPAADHHLRLHGVVIY